MKSQELFQDVGRGKILPLYYFYGPEKWLIEEAVNKIAKQVLNPATLDFNREVLDAEEDDTEAILGSLQVFPLRSPRRLVIIRRADIIWSKDPTPYLDYFANPNPSTCVFFIGEKADLRTKFFQTLGKNGAVVSFYPPYEKELIGWIRFQTEQMGRSISDEALSLLLERVGPNLQELKIELQKLSLRGETGKSIQEEDVMSLTEDVREESPFELPSALGNLDWGKTMRLLRKNLQQGESPIFLLSLIHRQLRLIRRARTLRAEGGSKKEVETTLRILPQRAYDFWKQVDHFPPSVLAQIWPLTREADQELKSSRLDKGLILEKFLWELFLHFREGKSV